MEPFHPKGYNIFNLTEARDPVIGSTNHPLRRPQSCDPEFNSLHEFWKKLGISSKSSKAKTLTAAVPGPH